MGRTVSRLLRGKRDGKALGALSRRLLRRRRGLRDRSEVGTLTRVVTIRFDRSSRLTRNGPGRRLLDRSHRTQVDVRALARLRRLPSNPLGTRLRLARLTVRQLVHLHRRPRRLTLPRVGTDDASRGCGFRRLLQRNLLRFEGWLHALPRLRGRGLGFRDDLDFDRTRLDLRPGYRLRGGLRRYGNGSGLWERYGRDDRRLRQWDFEVEGLEHHHLDVRLIDRLRREAVDQAGGHEDRETQDREKAECPQPGLARISRLVHRPVQTLNESVGVSGASVGDSRNRDAPGAVAVMFVDSPGRHDVSVRRLRSCERRVRDVGRARTLRSTPRRRADPDCVSFDAVRAVAWTARASRIA